MNNKDLTKPSTVHRPPSIVALAGGVGGAKLAEGLAQILPPEALTVIVNTGDDFVHWGLNISPDLDTVCYTLAGLANPVTGWGRMDESWNVFEQMEHLGAEAWFRLGDKDLATHLERTRRLRDGEPLSRITRDLCARWGIRHTVLPMSDAPVATMVDTVEMGELAFQEYFVHQRCQPTVKGFRFAGIESARPAPGVLEAIEAADAIVICPSNPWVSVDPILKALNLPSAVRRPRSTVAVSPIIGGKTVKGPAAKMFAELGIEPSALAVARHYGSPLLTGFVLDAVDAGLAEAVADLTIVPFSTNTIMNLSDNRRQLAQDVLNFIQRLAL
jgi:LPPG:FO 2-phospho-L-lactate transferase